MTLGDNDSAAAEIHESAPSAEGSRANGASDAAEASSSSDCQSIVEVEDQSEADRFVMSSTTAEKVLSRQERRSLARQAEKGRVVSERFMSQEASAAAQRAARRVAADPRQMMAPESLAAIATAAGGASEVTESNVGKVLSELLTGLPGGNARVNVGAIEQHLKGKLSDDMIKELKTAIGKKTIMKSRDFKKILISTLTE